jgi:RNA polymerase sigma-70 factor (ECF subfamily)
MGAERGEERGDEQLLAAVADGDRGALASLYRRHAPWLSLRLARRCGDGEMVDSALQDTFVAVWRKPDSYQGRGDVGAWLWGIAIRRLIDQLRRRPVLGTRGASEELRVSAEDEVLLGVEHGDLAGSLEGLSPALRAVVQATVLDGLTTREAARLLGIPAGTVKTRMSRARIQLREALA